MSVSSTPTLQDVAQALLKARGGPLADLHAFSPAIATPDDAWRVQDLVLTALDGHAGPRLYWKSSGQTNAPAAAGTVWSSPANASEHPFNFRAIEAEIALRLGRDVEADEAAKMAESDAPACLDAMAVSIEIVDSRWKQHAEASPLAKLADLQVNGGLVLGDWQPLRELDWKAQSCIVQIGDAAPKAFQGSYAKGNPAWLVPAWLRHLTRHGEKARKGTVVTTGTWCGLLQARAGDRVTVRFEGIGEAVVQL